MILDTYTNSKLSFINFGIPLIKDESNKLKDENVNQHKIHNIPIKIHFNGIAPVDDYFNIITESEVDLESEEIDKVIYKASIRGVPLVGKTVNLPKGYSGFILDDSIPSKDIDIKKELVSNTLKRSLSSTIDLNQEGEEDYNGILDNDNFDLPEIDDISYDKYITLSSQNGISSNFKSFCNWSIGVSNSAANNNLMDEMNTHLELADVLHA